MNVTYTVLFFDSNSSLKIFVKAMFQINTWNIKCGIDKVIPLYHYKRHKGNYKAVRKVTPLYCNV